MAGLCFYKDCASRVKSFRDDWMLKTGQENFNLWRAPKSADKLEWLRNLPPDFRHFDFENPKHVLCSLHFEEHQIIRSNIYVTNGKTYSFPLGRPRLAKNAVPTIFEGTDITSMTMKRNNNNSDVCSSSPSNGVGTHPHQDQNGDDEVNFQIMNVGCNNGDGLEVQQILEEVDESMVETQLIQDFGQEVFGDAEIPREGSACLMWELGLDVLEGQMQNVVSIGTEQGTSYSGVKTEEENLIDGTHFEPGVLFSTDEVQSAMISPSHPQEKGIEASVLVDDLCNGVAEDQENEENFKSSESEIKSEKVNFDETVVKNEYTNSEESDEDETNDKTNFSCISETEERIGVVNEVMNMGNDNEIKSDESKWPRPAGSSRKRKQVFSRSVSEEFEPELESTIPDIPEVESEIPDIPEDDIEVIDLSGDEDDGQNTHKNSKRSSEPKEANKKSTDKSQTAESSSQPMSESDNISSWSDLISFPSQNILDTPEVVENIPEISPEMVRKKKKGKNSVEVEQNEMVEISTAEIVPETRAGTSAELSALPKKSKLEEKFPWITTTKLHHTAKVKLSLTPNEKDINILKRCATTPTVLLSNRGQLTKKKRLQNPDCGGTGLITANLMSLLPMPNQDWCVNTYPIPFDGRGAQLFTVSETIINCAHVEIIRKSITIHPNWNMTFTVFSTPLKNFKIGEGASTTQDVQEIIRRFGELGVCEGIPRLGNYKYLPLFETRLRSTIDYCYRSPSCPLLLVVPTKHPAGWGENGRKSLPKPPPLPERCLKCKEMKECLEFMGSKSHLMAAYEHLFV